MIMSTKRKFPTKQNNQLFHIVDWFPTLLTLAGVSIPEKNDIFELDGRDFSNYFSTSSDAKGPRNNMIVGVRHYLTASNG